MNTTKKKDDDSVELTDVVGKSGIEQVMNDYLSGTKGKQKLYVDSIGNLIQVSDYEEPESGDDVYLSIDKDLQERPTALWKKRSRVLSIPRSPISRPIIRQEKNRIS